MCAILLFSFSFSQTGKASYYGGKFHGKKTSSGKIFNMNELTCSSMDYPLGTRLKITNLENNKSVEVLVTDRGGFKKYGRILDLSKGAFQKIASLSKGIITIIVEKIET